MPLDIRALNAFQRILDDPRSTPQDLAQVILNSNLMNMLARQQEEDRAESERRWNLQYGLQEAASERADTQLEANLKQLDENIAAMQKRLGFEEQRLDLAKEQNEFNQGMSLYQMGLQFPGTGFANPATSQTLSELTGIPLPTNYGQGVQSDAWTGQADPFVDLNATGTLSTGIPQPSKASIPAGGYTAGAPGSAGYLPYYQ
jgi:hypothetical protein